MSAASPGVWCVYCLCNIKCAIVCVTLNAPLFVWHDAFICATWRIHRCDTAHSYVWHDSFICVTRRIYACDTAHSYARHDSLICVTRLIQMCDATHSYVWHDSFIRAASVIRCVCYTHMSESSHALRHTSTRCNTLQLYSNPHCNYIPIHHWCDACVMCVTWLTHMCVMTHPYVWHNSFIFVTWYVVCVTRFVYTNASWRVTCRVRDVCDIRVTCRMRDMIRVHECVMTCDMSCAWCMRHTCDMSCAWHDSFTCATW